MIADCYKKVNRLWSGVLISQSRSFQFSPSKSTFSMRSFSANGMCLCGKKRKRVMLGVRGGEEGEEEGRG